MATINTPVDFATKKVSPGRLLLGAKNVGARIGGEDSRDNDNYIALGAYIEALGFIMSLGGLMATPADRNWMSLQQEVEGMFRFFLDNGDNDPTNNGTEADSLNQGTVLINGTPNDTDEVTIDAGPNDGSHSFEFDSNASATGVSVTIESADARTMENLTVAINANIGNDARAFYIKPDADEPQVLILANILGTGDTNAITETDTAGVITVSGMT